MITDENFLNLVESVKNDGFMLSMRFLVVDRNMVVQGGNQRLRACQVAGIKQIPVVKAHDLTKDQLKEFIIKDNLYFGEFDNEKLAEYYSDKEMVEVGLKLIEVSTPRLEVIGEIQPEIDESDLKNRKDTYENNQIKQIVVYFPADLYEKIVCSIDIIKKHMECNENPEVLLKLINHWKANYVS